MKKRYISLSLLLVVLLSSCGLPVRITEVRGSGHVQTETRRISEFNSVSLDGIGRLVITQGDTESLQITADDNFLQYIESNVSGRHLRLGVQEFMNLNPTADILYELTVKDLNSVETNGVGSIEIGSLETDELNLGISGAGNISVDDLTADTLNLVISGMGNVNVSGRLSDQRIKISGAGNYQATDLFSRETEVTISGTGNAKVWAADKLTVELSGMGSVNYYGDPILNMDISGMGNVESLGSR